MSWLVIVKVTLVFLSARLMLVAMRRASAARRHLVVSIALLAGLAIPALEAALPAWEVLPRPTVSRADGSPAQRRATAPNRSATVATRPSVVVAAAPAAVDAGRWLPVVWLAGVGGHLVLLLGRAMAMQITARRAGALRDPGWENSLDRARAALGIRRRVQLRLRPAGTMPAVWGWRRPVVLLPRDCLSWTLTRRRDVLAHELAHVKRRDVPLLTIAHVACALHWFNPLAWALKSRLAAESEHACDDLVLAQGSPAPRYADHLLATAAGHRRPYGLAPVMAAPSQLEERIMAILEKNRSRASASFRMQIIVMALATAAVVPLSSLGWAQARDMWAGTVHAHAHVESHGGQFAAHLEQLGIDRADTDALLAALAAADALTRAAGAWALGDIDQERVIDPLIQASYDADAIVRQWAVRSLASWNAPRIARPLVDRLTDNDAEVRQWAVRTLVRHDPAVTTQPLIDTLADGDAEVREWAVRVLADVGDARVEPALAARVGVETDSAVSEWLVRSLGGSDDPRSLDALLGALDDDSPEVRQWAVRGLAGSADGRAVDALIAMLRDADAEVREWSARGLGVCGNERAVPALQAMSRDPSDSVREWAGRALEQIDC